jgi:uncharacterized membrane protein
MKIGFAQPVWLYLGLLLVLVVILEQKSLSSLTAVRRWISLVVRLLILSAMILALAGIEIRRKNDHIAAVYLLDHSESVPEKYRNSMLDYVKAATEPKKEEDQAGVVIFAGDASIETMPSSKLDVQKVYSVVNPHATDIAQGLRLAQASLPLDYQRRIVLISDGNENLGDALQEVQSVRANGVAVDVLAVEAARREDIQVEKFVLPSLVKKGETFEAKIHLLSTQAGSSKLRIFRNGKYLGEQEVTVSIGRNVFSFPQQMEEAGFHSYHVEVDAAFDDIPQNNKGASFTCIRGDPTALCVHADRTQSVLFDQALGNVKIHVKSVGLDGMPATMADFLNYDLIVLSNINAGELSDEQMKLLQSAVRDYGVGLVVIGGDDSFTAGGYRGTTLEDILPVSMDLSSKKVLPSGALALLVHATEFSDGNRWARDIAIAALESLGPSDYMGIVLWDGQDKWLFPMTQVGDRKKIGQMISGMNPGDMPSFVNAMKLAHQGLKECKAHLKHLIVFSDGDPQPPMDADLDSIRSDKITISTVMIGGHVAPDPMMKMAQRGGGRFHDVRTPNHLPQIFIKESAVILKASIFEEPIQPKLSDPSEILRGIPGDSIPQLLGYVATSKKTRAEMGLVSPQGDPILAQWQYGLGRVVVFTSDVKPKWASQWMRWDRWDSFWGQTARWVVRRLEASSYDAHFVIRGGTGKLFVDAMDSSGNFLNHLDLQSTLTYPTGKALEQKLRQTEPGHYEVTIPAGEVGAYMANIRTVTNGVTVASQTVGNAISYSPEFKDLEPNLHLLRKVSDLSSGNWFTAKDSPFKSPRVPVFRASPIWHWLLALAILLFPFDVGIRRVMIDREQWKEFFVKALQRIGLKRPQTDVKSDEAMSALLNRKAQIRERTQKGMVAQTPPSPITSSVTSPCVNRKESSVPSAPKESDLISKTKPVPLVKTEDYTSQLLAAKRRAQQDKKNKTE